MGFRDESRETPSTDSKYFDKIEPIFEKKNQNFQMICYAHFIPKRVECHK